MHFSDLSGFLFFFDLILKSFPKNLFKERTCNFVENFKIILVIENLLDLYNFVGDFIVHDKQFSL